MHYAALCLPQAKPRVARVKRPLPVTPAYTQATTRARLPSLSTDAVEYDRSATISGPGQPQVVLSWAVDGDWVHFEATASTTAWVGVGISSTGMMIGAPVSGAVIAMPGSGTPLGFYHLDATAVQNITLQPANANFVAGNVTQQGGTTTFSWSRKFDIGDGSAALVRTGTTHVLCAVGASNTFAHHKYAYVSDVVIDYQYSASINSADMPDVVLYWAVDAGASLLRFKAVAQATAWLGVGVSANGMMIDETRVAGAAIARPDFETELGFYHLDATAVQNITLQPANPNFVAGSVTQEGGTTTMEWQRAYDIGDGSSAMSATGPTYFLCAVGKSNTLAHHKFANVARVFLNANDAAYTHSAVVSSPSMPRVELFWAAERGNEWLHFKAVAATEAWLGIGASSNGMMIADPVSGAAIARPGFETPVGFYHLDDTRVENITLQRGDAGFVAGSVTQEGGNTTMTWARKFDVGDGSAALVKDGPSNILVAVGASNTLAHHKYANVARVSLNPGSFPHSVHLNDVPPLDLAYGVDGDYVHFQATLQHTSWLAIGVSAHGKMLDTPRSAAVLGKPEEIPVDGGVGYYHLTGFSPGAIVRQQTTAVANVSLTQDGGSTVLTFTRRMDAGDSAAQISKNGTTNLIFAIGKNNTFAHHLTAGSKAMDFGPAPPPPSHGHAQLDSNFALQWTVDAASQEITVTGTLQRAAWAAFGISPSGKMVGDAPHTDAFIARPDQGSLSEYTITGKDSSAIVAVDSSLVRANSMTQKDGVTTFTFTRKMDTGDSARQVFQSTGPTTIVWAYGHGNEFMKHDKKGTLDINFGSGNVGPASDRDFWLRAAHGMMMFAAFGLLFPAGVAAARYCKGDASAGKKKGDPMWFTLHRTMQYTGVVLVLASFGIIAYACKGAQFAAGAHAWGGLAVIVLTAMQPVNACMRPHRGQPRRGLWEGIHKTAGRLIIVGAPVVIVFGTQKLNDISDREHQSTVPRTAYIVVAALTLLVFAVMEWRLRAAPRRSGGADVDDDGRAISRSEITEYRRLDESGARV